MTVVRCLALAVLLFASSIGHAQIAAYGMATLNAYGASNGSTISLKSTTGGPTLGGFYNFPIQSRLTAGIDVRTTFSPGDNGGNFTGVAFRMGFVPTKVRLRPYFQLGGGVVSTTVPVYVNPVFNVYAPTNQRHTSGALQLALGLDIRLTDHWDYRVLDYGAAAGGSSSGSAGVGWASAGVVYHFGPVKSAK